jgi:hypothetical protein
MTEPIVVSIMGRPTASFEAPHDVASWFHTDKKCISTLARVVLYDHYRRDDVIVGLDEKGVVQCTRTTRGTLIDFSVVD